ncbi:unnamed protein product [Caretta caretta]
MRYFVLDKIHSAISRHTPPQRKAQGESTGECFLSTHRSEDTDLITYQRAPLRHPRVPCSSFRPNSTEQITVSLQLVFIVCWNTSYQSWASR